MLFTFPEGHVRQLLLMVRAETLYKALPHSHFSLITADDIKTWVILPINQSIQSHISTEPVVLCPGAIFSPPLGRHWEQEEKHRQLAEECAPQSLKLLHMKS